MVAVTVVLTEEMVAAAIRETKTAALVHRTHNKATEMMCVTIVIEHVMTATAAAASVTVHAPVVVFHHSLDQRIGMVTFLPP